ncbi:hypothetical protein Ancab_015003 [Ancistrocladus abbreviatus]
MGGHGGLNILPQKRWNVYNYENREKVRRDEEGAAREEQLQREEARRREADSRLDQLRRARGLVPPSGQAAASNGAVEVGAVEVEPESISGSDSKHINLFDGIKIFDPVVVSGKEAVEEEGRERKRMRKEAEKMRKEAASKVVGPEEERYRLGYGIVGKDVKAPWYVMRPSVGEEEEEEEEERGWGGNGEERRSEKREGSSGGKKKTLEELREERLKREKKEKERERALLQEKGRRSRVGLKDKGHYRRGS